MYEQGTWYAAFARHPALPGDCDVEIHLAEQGLGSVRILSRSARTHKKHPGFDPETSDSSARATIASLWLVSPSYGAGLPAGSLISQTTL